MRWIPVATSMTAGSYARPAGMIAPMAAETHIVVRSADRGRGRPRPREPGALAPYCDGPWDVALRNVADVPERYLDIPGFSPGGDGTLTARFPTSHEATRMVHTPEQMVAELRGDPHRPRGALPRSPAQAAVLPQADYAAALARAYNAWLVDQWTSRHAALLGAIVACPQDPEDAAREIERYADDPSIVAVYLPCAGLDPLWGHRRYDPIFDAAQNARPARAAALGHGHLAGLPVQQPRLRHGVRPPRHEPHLRDHRQPGEHGLHGRRRPLPGAEDRGHRGGDLVDAVPVQPARQGVPRAPAGGPVPHGAPEPLRQARLRGDPADRGARAAARPRRR